MPTVKINYLIYVLLIVSPIYLDSPFSLFLGAAGNSPSFVLCYLLFAFFLINRKKIDRLDLALSIAKLSFFILIIGFIANIVYLTQTGNHTFANYNIFSKNIFVFLQTLSYPLYLILICHYGKSLDINHIFLPIVIVFVFLAAFCVLEFKQLPNAFNFLHFRQPCPYHRIRLLTQESSWTMSIILNYFALSLYYSRVVSRNRKIIWLIIPSALILFSLSSSKNLLIASGLFVFFYVLYFWNQIKKKDLLKFATIIVSFIILSQWVYSRLSILLLGDIENYTSTSTRTYSLISGLWVSIKYPFGVGGGLWQKCLIETMKENMVLIKSYFPNFNYSEILFYCSHLSKEATAKSGLVQHSMYWGILGTLFFIAALRKFYIMLKKSSIPGKRILFPTLITNFLLICFNTDIGYDMLMVVGVMLLLYKKNSEDATHA